MDGMKQGAFDTMVRQALGALTSEQSAAAVAEDAAARGPEAAIAEAVDRALEGIVTAAQKAGVRLPPEAVKGAAVAVAGAMSSMMAEAGGTEDPKALLQAVMQILSEGGGEGEPGPEEGPGPEEMPEPGAGEKPRGALAMG